MPKTAPSLHFLVRGRSLCFFSVSRHSRFERRKRGISVVRPGGVRTSRRERPCSCPVLPRRVVRAALSRFVCRFSLFRVFPFAGFPERTIMCEEKHEVILRRRCSRQRAMEPCSGVGPQAFPFFPGASGAPGMSRAFGRYRVAGVGFGCEVRFGMVCVSSGYGPLAFGFPLGTEEDGGTEAVGRPAKEGRKGRQCDDQGNRSGPVRRVSPAPLHGESAVS